jgi:hypothetical protein
MGTRTWQASIAFRALCSVVAVLAASGRLHLFQHVAPRFGR